MGRIVSIAVPPYGQQYPAEIDPETHEIRFTELSTENFDLSYRVFLHPEGRCFSDDCAIHNPSDHPLNDADMVLRLDKSALIERVCEHGVGHPDPDSVAYLESVGEEGMGVHGCDGCCAEV